MSRFTIFCTLLAFVFGTGCAHQNSIQIVGIGQGVELAGTPFYPQEEYQCGPASLAMLLGASGIVAHPDELAPLIYIPGRQGSLQTEMAAVCRKYGRIPYPINPDLNELISEIRSGSPVLVLQNQGFKFLPLYHYAVVIGVLPGNRIVLRSGTDKRVEMKADHFYLTWKRAGAWGLVLLRPGDLPEKPDPLKYINAVVAFESSGDAFQAAEGYQAALDLWPENQTALFALANNYLKRKETIKATALYQKLLDLNPDHVAAANNLSEALAMQGRYSEALIVIQEALMAAERIKSPLLESLRQTAWEINLVLQEKDSEIVPSGQDEMRSVK